jgi:hypothetical protein
MGLALTGCFDDKSGAPTSASSEISDVSTEISATEWRAVINDWYVDGTINESHRCVAIQEAIDQLPRRDYSTAYADLRRSERDTCS